MPKQTHAGPTMTLTLRIEVNDVVRLEKYKRRILKGASKEMKATVSKNWLIVQAVKDFLARNE